mmetsp:Transcript_107323/g.213050  ORF Transcript_107323/g.213050 Transcript_107323/m.213050 type:complete len:84 (+) Transcript_107323:385-636(+)
MLWKTPQARKSTSCTSCRENGPKTAKFYITVTLSSFGFTAAESKPKAHVGGEGTMYTSRFDVAWPQHKIRNDNHCSDDGCCKI